MQTNFENSADSLKAEQIPSQESWMCRDLRKQRAMKLLQSIPLHRLPPFQHSEGLKLDFSNLTILLPSAFQLLQPARKTEELHVLIKGKKKKKKRTTGRN